MAAHWWRSVRVAGIGIGLLALTATPAWARTSSGFAIVPSANPFTYSQFLRATSASGPNDVWAVGGFDTGGSGGHDGPFTEHWDGSAWSYSPAAGGGQLTGVVAFARKDAWLVGSVGGPGSVQHWDGHAWTYLDPAPGYPYTEFNDLAASGKHNMWAVGRRQPTPGSETIPAAIHWDDSSWSSTDPVVPDPAGVSASFVAVAPISPHNVWAVGVQTSGVLIERWDGTAWKMRAPPDGLAGAVSISATSRRSGVWIAGEAGDGTPAVTRWDGHAWTTWQMPVSDPDHMLRDIIVINAGDVWAVGTRRNPSGETRTWIVHWDGAAWSDLGGPNVAGSPANALNSITFVSGFGVLWSVGTTWSDSAISGDERALTLRRS